MSSTSEWKPNLQQLRMAESMVAVTAGSGGVSLAGPVLPVGIITIIGEFGMVPSHTCAAEQLSNGSTRILWTQLRADAEGRCQRRARARRALGQGEVDAIYFEYRILIHEKVLRQKRRAL
jgi:hypothetical protein